MGHHIKNINISNNREETGGLWSSPGERRAAAKALDVLIGQGIGAATVEKNRRGDDHADTAIHRRSRQHYGFRRQIHFPQGGHPRLHRRGIPEIDGFLSGEDCLSTISCFEKMGVRVGLQGKK